MSERWKWIAWAALLVQIPFELKYTFAGLSNLQWTFVALAAVHVASLYSRRKEFKGDRMMQAAALLIALQWLAAFLAPEFNGNAWKGAMRFTIGLTLMAMARLLSDRALVLRVWAITAVIAALYALIAQEAFGVPWLFRNSEYFIAQVQRLSGSFEYPNIAAAYFAMSLPIVWWARLPAATRWGGAVILWCALILTFSRGAAAAVVGVAIGKGLLSYRKKSAWMTVGGLVATGIAGTALAALFSSHLIDLLKRSSAENPPSAQYKMAWNRLRERPGAGDMLQLHVRNTGHIPWLAEGAERVAVGYRWRNQESKRLKVGAPATALPHDVKAGESIELPVNFQTPETPGRYLLIVELFVRKFDWFSNAGVIPAVIEADIQPGVQRFVEVAEPFTRPSVPRDARVAPDPIPRLQLWHAAFEMFRVHPLGVGPDNYRLMYGRFLGYTSWNTKIYSNNLYLELLTGSGILGLMAFGLMILAIPGFEPTAAVMAIGVFLLHGLLDVFLMTTPIYFSFWILMGVCHGSRVPRSA